MTAACGINCDMCGFKEACGSCRLLCRHLQFKWFGVYSQSFSQL